MGRLAKDDFVSATCRLLDEHGFEAVTIANVLKACEAQRGSLYHFFPNGKEDLLIAAIQAHGEKAVEDVSGWLASSEDAGAGVYLIATHVSDLLEASDFRFGLPFSALAVTAGLVSDAVRAECERVCAHLESLLVEKFKADGVSLSTSRRLSRLCQCGIEGAYMQARTRRSTKPLREMAVHLRDTIQAELAD